jgi:uncharacterized membrane protein
MRLLRAFEVLPLIDWLALVAFFTAWIGYAMFARHRATKFESLLATTNRHRQLWMLETTRRENRVVDGVVVQNMSTSPSFFASTTIFIIGGLLAVLGTQGAAQLVTEFPFAAATSAFVFDLKLLLLIGIFVYAFFRFTWSMRQYTFGALIIASMPDAKVFESGEVRREAYAARAGKVVGMAAETFNDGLRACYMAFAALMWFSSAVAFVLATLGIVFLLYRREFHSDVLEVLRAELEDEAR